MKVIITADDFTVPAGTVLDVGPEVPRAFEGKCRVYNGDRLRESIDQLNAGGGIAHDLLARPAKDAPAIVAQNTKPKRA